MRKLGVKVHDAHHGFLYCEAEKIKGTEIQLDFPSVGATENIMLAAVFAEGETTIRHAAREPEIVDLQKFLVGMGADVTGAGTSTIRIRGSSGRLRNVEHTVIPDRIVAGTYLVAAGITGGDLTLKNVSAEHIVPVISYLRECGCRINTKKTTMHISGPTRPRSIDIIRTLPYPGFPTDMQSQFITLLSIARGTSIFVETIFENRYKHVEELMRMGANIRLEGSLAVIKGVRELTGATVTARDLRGGAALVLAGLVAEGTTVISGIKHIDRGYENIEDKLSKVGALIVREE
jgi:UDP-N-acetylglucosamine 1-carboxyvinyltransferase